MTTKRGMRIESLKTSGAEKDGVLVNLYVEGYHPTHASADSVVQAIISLIRDPALPRDVLEWLAPKDGVLNDEPHELHELRVQVKALEDTNAGLRSVIDDTKREAESLRRMVDLLLDRVEGRRG